MKKSALVLFIIMTIFSFVACTTTKTPSTTTAPATTIPATTAPATTTPAK